MAIIDEFIVSNKESLRNSVEVAYTMTCQDTYYIASFSMRESKPSLIYSVSDLVGEMRKLMETSYPEIWIEGELSSLSTPASGHLYFSLKDDQATLRCAMFRNRASLSRYKAKSGDLVRVRAKISVYTARGDLQCIVQHIEEAGTGLLQRRYEELKAALNEEGLFSADHKETLPKHPKRIGLITSATGAAVQDVLTTLRRRNPSIAITIYPSVVQGEGAAENLCSAIRDAQQHAICDCLLLTRGGGSIEDLWSFNDEGLARTIYACEIPIVSAVGHEVDVTIADLVADLRAPTPTAAAELLSADQRSLLRNIEGLAQRMQSNFVRRLQSSAQTVDLWFSKLTHPRQRIQTQQVKIGTLALSLERHALLSHRQKSQLLGFYRQQIEASHPQKSLLVKQQRLRELSESFSKTMKRRLEKSNSLQSNIAEQLHLVSPLATLARGFSIAQDSSNTILRSSDSVGIGDRIDIKLHRGSLECEVSSIYPTEHEQ